MGGVGAQQVVYYIHILDLSVTYLDKLFLLHNC